MKRFIHAVLCLLAFVPWAAAMVLLTLCGVLVVWADKVWPEADWGNCWTKAGPLWWKNGGYLCVRPADGQKLFGLFSVPHAIWMPTWPEGTDVRQTHPLHRRFSALLPWYTIYFKLKVLHTEKPHNGTPL